MRAVKNLRPLVVLASVVIGLLSLIFVPQIAKAQQKGAEKLVQMTAVKTFEDLQNIEPGDLIVMSCPKCKDSWGTVAEKTYKAAHPVDLKTIQIHLCSSCDTKIETKGHGKDAKNVLVHTCKTCGSKDAFCCVMKKGTVATLGMAEKK